MIKYHPSEIKIRTESFDGGQTVSLSIDFPPVDRVEWNNSEEYIKKITEAIKNAI